MHVHFRTTCLWPNVYGSSLSSPAAASSRLASSCRWPRWTSATRQPRPPTSGLTTWSFFASFKRNWKSTPGEKFGENFFTFRSDLSRRRWMDTSQERKNHRKLSFCNEKSLEFGSKPTKKNFLGLWRETGALDQNCNRFVEKEEQEPGERRKERLGTG